MRQQPEHAVGGRRQLRIVVVHRVAARGVRERRLRGRRRHQFRPEQGGFRTRSARLDVLADDRASVHGRAGEDDAEPVDQAAFGFDDRFVGYAVEAGVRDEVDEGGGGADGKTGPWLLGLGPWSRLRL